MLDKVNRKIIFEAVRGLLKKHQPAWVTYTQDEVKLLDAAIDAAFAPQVIAITVPEAQKRTKFVLGEQSQKKLAVVHPKLRACIERAISYSLTDFRVGETERSLAQQKENVRKGVSRTMKSKHFKQADGWVWAADLIALVNGKVSWEMPLYAAIAYAMDRAATELGVAEHIRWGCAWDRVLSDFGGDADSYLAEVKAYAKRHPGSDLLDGPHFEWVA